MYKYYLILLNNHIKKQKNSITILKILLRMTESEELPMNDTDEVQLRLEDSLNDADSLNESSDSSDSEGHKGRGLAKEYDFIATFENLELAQEHMKENFSDYKYRYAKSTQIDGCKRYYISSKLTSTYWFNGESNTAKYHLMNMKFFAEDLTML